MRLDVYMNKKPSINILITSVIAVIMCSCSNTYPPSEHIGIFDSYDGYKNGELPFKEDGMYSGVWNVLYPYSKQIRVQGTYYKGIPDGEWKSFYRSGEVQFFAIYNNGKKEQMVSYCPDGIPYSISKSGKVIEYYPDGNLRFAPEKSFSQEITWNNFLLSNSPVQMSHFYKSDNASVYVYLYPEADNCLNIWCYIVSVHGISKSKISATLSDKTGLLKNINSELVYGNMETLLSSNINDRVLRIMLSLKSEQIKNAKLFMDIPLANLGESNFPGEYFSHSFR